MKLQEFERVYEELSPKVFNVAYRMTGSLEDAQDVLQDVFMKVWKHHKGFRGEAKLSTWIYRIAVNTAISLIRKRKPTKPIEDFEANVLVRAGNYDRLDGVAPLTSR